MDYPAGLKSYEGSGRAVGGWRTPLATGRAIWIQHHDILKNALSLLATTGVTSGLGFAYWDVAARLFNQRSVGYSVAAISVMTLLSWLGMFGLGTLLMGELPRRSGRRERASLISAAVIASALGSLVLTLGFILVVPHFTASFNDVTDSLSRAAVLCAAVVLTTMTLVFDSATIGLLRGGLQLTRNVTFVLVKMLTLIVAATVLHGAFGIGIFLSWVAAIPLSLVPVVIRLWRTGELMLPKPDWQELKSLGKTVIAHNWLNLAIQAPPLLMPVIVASKLSASSNAGFYVAWTISNMLYLLPAHLSTVLFAVAAGDPQALAPKLRFTLRTSILIGVPGMLVLAFGSHFILSIFGAGYARFGAVPMVLMVLGYLPSIPKFYYIAVCRAQGSISRAAAVLTSFSALEITVAIIGIWRDGIVGLLVGLLIVSVIEGIVTLPAVVRAALVRGRHRRESAQEPVPGVVGPLGWAIESLPSSARSADSEIRKRAQQQAGLAVLMSLAIPARAPLVPLIPESHRTN